MAKSSPRAYLVGTEGLRDRLISELAAAGVIAIAGGGVDTTAWAAAKHLPRLVFVLGEAIPYGVTPIALRRCQHHRDRNEAINPHGPAPSGTSKLCSECREARQPRQAGGTVARG
jgi:hypothetical protein